MSLRILAGSHPTAGSLQTFALGTCTDPHHRRIHAHVAECESCRERVVALVAERPFTSADRTVTTARNPALARILDRRQHGDRVLLPDGDAARGRHRGRRVPAYAAAAATLLIGIATAVFSSEELTASDVSGELRFAPQLPAAGDSIQLEYRGARFGRAAELSVRALLRTADDAAPDWAARYGTVARLRRARDGAYRGTFVLPDSVVYGAFAVEDTAGAQVDTRGGRLWDLLVRDDSMRPAFAAMRQQMRFHHGRAQEVSLAIARELVKVHADDPRSWQLLLWYETQLAGPAGRAVVYERFRPRFAAAHERLRATIAVPPRLMETMWLYAGNLGEDSAAHYWSRRLSREHPRAPEGAVQRYFALPSAIEPSARDSALEQLWRDVGASHSEALAFNGFMNARGRSDTAGIRRWGSRLERFGPPWYGRSLVGYSMARMPGLEWEAAARLRAHIREFDQTSDLHRIVGETVAQHRQRIDMTRASALVELGHALAAMNRPEAALDTLELAAELAWKPAAYLEIAALNLQRRDTAAALRAAAYAAADGSVPTESAELRARLGAVADSVWSSLVEEGRSVQRRKLLATSVDRPIRARVQIKDSSGRERDLADVVRGAPTVVAFWSRYCIGSLEQLPELQRAMEQLVPTGARLVAITSEMPSPELTAWLKGKGYTFEVYHDYRHEAAAVLQPWATPDNLVLDARGRLRFQRVSTKDVVGRVEVLR
jgi:hypothetical protein